jgi:hypothetical protein
MVDPLTYRRAVHASLAGLVVQILLGAGLLLVTLGSHDAAAAAATWHAAGGLPAAPPGA